jgi:hypothetical protein
MSYFKVGLKQWLEENWASDMESDEEESYDGESD